MCDAACRGGVWGVDGVYAGAVRPVDEGGRGTGVLVGRLCVSSNRRDLPAKRPRYDWEANPNIHCWDTTYHDPAGLHHVYYTAAPDDPERVVLYIISPPYETRRYNCDTGEIGMERAVDEYQGFYATLIYDREAGAWKLGRAAEEFNTLPSDADVDGSISLIRQLQGR